MNHQIRVPQVRCIDADGGQIGIIQTGQALLLAKQRGLDLVEISPTAQPPVCRVMDYGKYKYELGKKEKQGKKHASATRVKEVKFHPNVEQHDFEIKTRQIRTFIEEGHRVKVSLMFRGRENAHHEIGYEVMKRVLKYIEDLATSDRNPQLMGRNLIMLLTPKPVVRKTGGAEPAPQPSA